MLDPGINFPIQRCGLSNTGKFAAKSPLALFNSCLVFFFFQSSLAVRCPQRPIACDMVALGIHQSFHTTMSVVSRVLTVLEPLVLAYEDASKMDFGVEKNFLANVSTREAKINNYQIH